MKLFYFSMINPLDIGVVKKIESQIKYLEKNGVEVKQIKSINNNGRTKVLIEDKELIEIHYSKSLLKKIKKEFISKISIFNQTLDYINKNKINVVYIRYMRMDFNFLLFLKKLKEKKIKIILEIPTYPIDGHIKNKNFTVVIDNYLRKLLKNYVSKIVTFSEDKEIFGIPCINISNGIDLEKNKIAERIEKNKEIIFTSVSNCSFWHGIDRILFSLEEYYKNNGKKEILFNIVGEGEENKNLKAIVEKSKFLKKKIKFVGMKTGDELDKIYNQTDICIGSLGRHRSGLKTMRALKNREYVSKGLPLIFSEDDPDLREVNFAYHVSPDEKIINIEEILEWYQNIKISREKIRNYSEKFSWDIQMKKVIEQIQS